MSFEGTFTDRRSAETVQHFATHTPPGGADPACFLLCRHSRVISRSLNKPLFIVGGSRGLATRDEEGFETPPFILHATTRCASRRAEQDVYQCERKDQNNRVEGGE